MELATRLLLFASIVIFLWTAISALVRPAARRFMEPISLRSPVSGDEPPPDFFRSDDDEESGAEARSRGPSRNRHRLTEDDSETNDDRTDGGKVELQAATARKDAKLYGQPSERSAEISEVRAGETIFIMKKSAEWVLVLGSKGAMMGWMRRDNVEAR